ncbi:MAG: hypothetical protein HZA54_16490 [Planctomycetes bacterium]|nr:hypothetical protein [Planctomycetota bacterium]
MAPRWAFGLLAATLVAGVVWAGDKKIYSNDYAGKEPPEIAIPAASWFNAQDAPTLKGLKGRVVWLEFSFIH